MPGVRAVPGAELLRHGTPTIGITEQRLTHDPDREAARPNEILDQLAPG